MPQGQQPVLEYGSRKPNRYGIAATVAVHLLVILGYFFHPKQEIKITPPAKEGELVWVAPLPKSTNKPTPQKPAPTKTAKAEKPKATRAYLPPNPNAITERIKPQERIVPPEQAKLTPPPPEVTDMQAMVEMRRRARNQDAPAQPSAAEGEAQAALNRARANIMGAQGRAANGERNDTGGIFQVVDKTFNGADIKFRGFSSNFKRQWSQQVHVDQGLEKDVETAIVKKMIEMIRKEKPGDFVWESHRLGRNVPMSARKEDEAELQAFLLQEFFPGYGKLR
jgi:type IV secretory pathway VirB10-like protein